MNGSQRIVLLAAACLMLGPAAIQASPKDETKKEEFPKFEAVSKDYTEVVSTADAAKPFYRVWKRDKDAQLLAELPADYPSKKFFVVPTVAGGDSQLGVYSIWHHLAVLHARLFGDRWVGQAIPRGIGLDETAAHSLWILAIIFVASLVVGIALIQRREIRVPAAVA